MGIIGQPGADGAVLGAVTIKLADVKPEPVRWLWPGRVALGKLTLLAGDPGLGKSLLTLDAAARVSRGAAWPEAPDVTQEPGGVVLLTAEDDLADTVRPRLDAAGADVARIVALRAVRRPEPESGGTQELPFNLGADLNALEDAIGKLPGCKLVIVDPISAYLPAGRHFDSHRNTDVRAVLAPLGELAARCGVAVVAVTHLRKSDGAAIYRAMGSLAFIAAARAAWAVTKDRDDAAGRRRLLLPVKSNLAAGTSGLAFTVEDANGLPLVRWEPGAVTISADDALGAAPTRPGPDAEDRDAATEWLRAALADGPRLARELTDQATNGQGIAKRTLDRARSALGVVAYREHVPGPWRWRLPAQGCQVPPEHQQLGNLGNLAKTPSETSLFEPPNPKVAKLAEAGNLAELGPNDRPPDYILEQAAEGAGLDGEVPL